MPIFDTEMFLDISIALTKEKNINKLMEIILDAAMDLMGCDGGTLYLLEDNALWFKMLITKSIGVRKVVGEEVDLPPVPLSHKNVSSRAVLDKTLINVANIYENTEFNFSGTKKYDAMIGYKTVSMLTVPMEDDQGDIFGVLQLINAQDESGNIIPFAIEYERILYSLASLAAICLTTRKYSTEIIELLDSFARAMSAAIDARSPYNANHTLNMTMYGYKFIKWLDAKREEIFDSERERKFLMCIWFHDIGKLTIPLEVMDKESRLGSRLGAILFRLQTFRMQAEIDYLRHRINSDDYEQRLIEIEKVQHLVKTLNTAPFLTYDMLNELKSLSGKETNGPNGKEAYLTPEELDCLLISKGTLTDEERAIMESHVNMTKRILSEVRFPRNYRTVPEWASSHHEHLNGDGYPDRLLAESLPTEVRILTILDVYDALTARDRPYRASMPTEKAFEILTDMAAKGQIDKRLLILFQKSEVWKEDL